MRTIVIAFLLFVLLAAALVTYKETHAQPKPQPTALAPTNSLLIDPMDNYLKDSRRIAWEQGYMAGSKRALDATQVQVQLMLSSHQMDKALLDRTMQSGLTNNPYSK